MENGIERFYLERGESSGERSWVSEGGLRERLPREGVRGLHGSSGQHADNDYLDRRFLLCSVSVQEALGTQAGKKEGKLRYFNLAS